MNKKIILCFFFLAGFTFFLEAQIEGEGEQKNYYQLGLNVGPLWKTIINNNPENKIFNFFNPEVISFKARNGNSTFRSGLGVRVSRSEDDDGDVTKQNAYSIRIGYEKLKSIGESKKYQYYLGWDVKLANSKFSSEFLTEPTTQLQYSFSPLFGVQYRLTPHLLLQTEASLNFFYSKSERSIDTFILPPIIEPGQSITTTGKGVFLNLPNLLFLTVEF